VTDPAVSEWVFLCIVVQSSLLPNVVDLKTFHPPAPQATPTVSLQHFKAKVTISFTIMP
jgi:hypothetical protein